MQIKTCVNVARNCKYYFKLLTIVFIIQFNLIPKFTMPSNRLLTIIILIALITNNNSLSAEKLTTISAIQGSNNTSPLLGKQVNIEGIVTADFQDDKSFAGFFIQSKSNKNKQSSSSGIFVYESHKKVTVGDLIRVTGKVLEHHGATQIADVQSITVLKEKQKLPKVVVIELPLKGFNLESLEGMRVTLGPTLSSKSNKGAIITDHYNYIKYGELTVSSQLLISPTNSVTPGAQVKLKQKQNTDDKLLIDDGSFSQFPHYSQINNETPVHIGAKVQVIGIMHYAFNKYRIEITEPIKFLEPPYPKQSKPAAIAGKVKIASFNLRNYFTTLDNGKVICGPNQNFDCRGADSDDEFIRQQSKLVRAINTADADVFALEELENNKDSIKTLVSALNKDANKDKWSFIKTGTLGEDVIRVGLIYQTKTITPIGQHKILNPKVMQEFEADKNRDVLLQTFKDSDNNLFNVAVLHLKSKRCSDAIGADKDQNDGQGCYNASRVKVAQQISDWLAQDPTGQKAQSTIVTGDFNSYLKEDPITLFEKNGYSNLTNDFLTSENWTSIFRGEIGSIDHILVNIQAKKAAQGMTQWHLNSIVQGWFDYNLEALGKSKDKPKNYYQASPFASSDHDMVIAGFTFSDDD